MSIGRVLENLGKFRHAPSAEYDTGFEVYSESCGTLICEVVGGHNFRITEFEAFFLAASLNLRVHQQTFQELLTDVRRIEMCRTFIQEYPNGPLLRPSQFKPGNASAHDHSENVLPIVITPSQGTHWNASDIFQFIESCTCELFHEVRHFLDHCSAKLRS